MATDKPAARATAAAGGQTGVVQKKSYSAPVLTSYGHISKLTMGGQGSGADLGTMFGMAMTCL